MPLTDARIRKAKPALKTARLFDGRGLYLEISPNGGKWWRMKYRFGGKEKRISLGVYPEVSLKDARNRCDDARKLLKASVDPSQDRKDKVAQLRREDSTANSFEMIAREWFALKSKPWADRHSTRVLRRFERDIFPWIGARPISEITAPELLTVMRRIESRGAADTSHRALGNCSKVFRYGVATGLCESDPTRDLRGALSPIQEGHFAAATEPQKVAKILRTVDCYDGTPTVRCALRLAPLVFVMPGELRTAEWRDIDLEKGEWRFLVTKTKTQHIVPLSRQAVEILRELWPLTGSGRYVFPSARSIKRPMSDNAVLAAMRRLEISKEEMTGHGFRATARTILDEILKVRVDYIEHQLAHAVKDPLGRAYNRTAFLPERKRMMQQWADYLDRLQAGAEVISIRQST